MKTLKNLYLPLLALFAVIVSTACGCIKPKLLITEDELIGKTKEEVLQIAFEKTEYRDEINLGTENKTGSLENFYFKTIEEARNRNKFYDSNSWIIWSKLSSAPIFARRCFLVIKFEDKKVLSVKKMTVSDGF